MRTMMSICLRIVLFLLAVAAGKQEYVYMDTEEACGQDVHLSDHSKYMVQTHPDGSVEENITGYFPCYHKFYSNNDIVCIQQQFIHFFNCTARLNYYTFKADVENISDLATDTPVRTIDCDNDIKDEWCSRGPTNVVILLERTEPSATIQDLFFILEVARIRSSFRRTWMFLDCGSKYYLKHSSIYVSLFAGDEDSCVKTFTYYNPADQRKSQICLKFLRWSKNRQCSSYQLQIFNHDSDKFGVSKHYKCSDPKPESLCVNSHSMTLKLIRAGDLKGEKEDFSLTIWDNYDGKQEPDEPEPESEGMSTNTTLIIVCVVIGVIIIFIMICALCKGGCRGKAGPVMCASISLPSLPSFPSLPSVAGFDDD